VKATAMKTGAILNVEIGLKLQIKRVYRVLIKLKKGEFKS
jgi:hypothetical protein